MTRSRPKKRKSPATLADFGEDRLLAALIPSFASGADVLVGAGDDGAVIGQRRDKRWQLLKTDAVVEGIHFQPTEDLRRVGWKAMCRALSDIAAMGGVPAHALVTLAASQKTPVTRVKALYAGLNKAAKRYGVALVGGETSRSPGPLFLSIMLTGWVEREVCVLRSGGQPGDWLYVTGRLGGSLSGKHLDFKPRLAEARWLVSHFKPRAMMDLSDGLAADLPRLAAASGCGYFVDTASLPLTPGCRPSAAMCDGEDYELLFAIAPRTGATLERTWKRRFPRVPLTRIGTLEPRGRANRQRHDALHGYDHFAQR
jgi:thiamine-monophosphate kinase